ncbi:MAG: futalosine hydrolase [Deltaproteobacteria bacterium]|nr:futalosine hydrolase [Deltaproteobacteria bacterium]
MTIWITAALKAELNLLKDRLNARRQGHAAGYSYYMGKMGSQPVRLGVVGIGPASAALALGVFFTLERPGMALMVGSAGALPESGLAVGDLVTAETEILAELGAIREAGIGDAARLKLTDTPQEIALDPSAVRNLTEAAAAVAPVHCGRVLTVMGIPAGPEQAAARTRHFRAVAENMEGYALALAGRRFGIPVAEVRGISNAAGDRDKSRWDFRTAQDRAQKAVLEFLKRLP